MCCCHPHQGRCNRPRHTRAPRPTARALRSGFQAHLPKPVEPDALIDTVTGLAGTAAPADS
jgi:hypothetical protein